MRIVILFFAMVVGVAAVSALVTRQFVERPPESQEALHRWLHERLDLTPDQKESLKKIEDRFAVEEQRLRDDLAQANRDLAVAISEDGSYTPRVSAAVERVHLQMGELQKLSIEHLFEMTTVLSPEQSARLMQYAEMALTEAP